MIEIHFCHFFKDKLRSTLKLRKQCNPWASTFKMFKTFKILIKELINLLSFFNFTIVITKSILQLATSLSNKLHITVLSVSS